MNSIKKTARITGFLYLLLIPLGVLGIIYVPATLFVPGDAASTASNILANESLFRLSIVSALLVQLVNLAVVLFLYKLLSPVNKNIARLMVMFIALAIPIAMLNELTQLAVLRLLNGADYLAVLTTDQLHALVSFFLELHQSGVVIAQIFWGLWLFPMGYLVFKSGYIPKIIGIMLMIGCFGYVVDSLTFLLYPDFGLTFAEYLFIGEVALPLWLLVMGVNVERWEKRTLSLQTA